MWIPSVGELETKKYAQKKFQDNFCNSLKTEAGKCLYLWSH